MPLVSVVTGANSGIGRATAIHLAGQGQRVIGTVRDVARAGKLQQMAADAGVEVELVTMDVADDDSVAKGFAEIFERTGQVDALVNNAGIGGNSVVEDMTAQYLLDVVNVDVAGGLRCLRQVLPNMRERGDGVVVNVTSVAGRFGAIAQAPYVAAKWAFEGLSEELALELAPFGVRVRIVEPGVTKSAIFAKNVDLPDGSIPAYAAQYRRLFDFYAAGVASATDPFDVAKVIHEAITSDSNQLRYPCSWGGKAIIDARQQMSDDEWIALGAAETDEEYHALFESHFGLDIRPPA